ncbi:hypothetical protein BH09MYX1_BH09MYX1_42850 [soil metagenome]
MPRIALSRRWKIGLAVAAALGLGCGLGVGPYARHRAIAEAERRGLELTIGTVSPGWFAIELRDLRVKPEGVEGVEVALDSVRVELSAGLRVQAVEAHGGSTDLVGPPDQVVLELTKWRERHRSEGTAGSTVTPMHLDGMKVAWSKLEASSEAAGSADGVEIRRDGEGTKLLVGGADVTFPGKARHLADADVSWDSDRHLHDAHAKVLELRLVLPAPSAAPAMTPTDEPPPPPIKGKPAPFVYSPMFRWPDLRALRAQVRSAMERLDGRIQDHATFGVDELSVGVTRGTDALVAGPGKMTIAREGSVVAVDFVPGAAATAGGSTPLALHASAPIGAGDVVVSLSGGPISLDLLGIKEGALGVEGTKRATLGGKATITLDDPGSNVVFDVDLSTKDFAIKNPRIATDPVRGLSLRAAIRGAIDQDGHLRIDDGELSVGALHLRGHGTLEQAADHLAANVSFELPTASCQSLLESVPPALVPHLAGARFKGTLAARGYAQFDTRKIDDLVLKYDFDDFCKMTTVPRELDEDRFKGRFTHPVVTKDDKPELRTTGPGEPDWTDVDDISPFMQVAVLTTEDGSFYRHHGFNHSAIRASLIANVKAGKFVRGASTITMQLAKNLFLTREKTVSRKLEELVLADYLEKTFRKEDLMELYLNVIEFGPDLYGVRDAATHYFGRRPDELNLAECLFLSSLLPNPKGYHKMYDKGLVSPYWITRIHQLMEVAEKNGKISPKELQEGEGETVAFHKEGDPPPVPRASIAGAHFTGDDGNEWEPLP